MDKVASMMGLGLVNTAKAGNWRDEAAAGLMPEAVVLSGTRDSRATSAARALPHVSRSAAATGAALPAEQTGVPAAF